MRLVFNKLMMALLFAIMAVAPLTQASAVQLEPEDILVDITLKDAEMIDATRVLMQKTGIEFVVEPSDVPFKLVTLRLERKPASEAIKYIVQAAGGYYRRDENGVYIISREAPPKPERTLPKIEPKKDVQVVKKIDILYADGREILSNMLYRIPFDSKDVFADLERFSNITRGIVDPRPSGPRLMGQNNQYNPTFQPVGSQSTAKPLNGIESGGDILLPGEGAGQIGRGGIGGGQFGGGGIGGGIGGGQFGGGGGIGGGGQLGGQLGAGGNLIPEGIDYIAYDPNTNSLVVRGTEEDINELQQYVSLFDVVPRQVIVKVEFITTGSSFTKALGFDWLYQRGTINFGNVPGTFARAGDPIFLNYATGNITTRMRALLLSGYGKTVNTPILRTLNNQPASISQQTQTTVFLNQVVSTSGGQVIIAPQLQDRTISTSLNIAPRINADDTITMYLTPQISDFGQIRRGPDGQEVPDLLSQSIQVVARVKSGETIVLGGLTRKSDTGSQAKLPILGDLPIIGQFFRTRNVDRNYTELLIFVTPTIVEDDENYGLGP